MTVKEARSLLSTEYKDVSDPEIENDIKAAQILKDLFFDFYRNGDGVENKMGVCNNETHNA